MAPPPAPPAGKIGFDICEVRPGRVGAFEVPAAESVGAGVDGAASADALSF